MRITMAAANCSPAVANRRAKYDGVVLPIILLVVLAILTCGNRLYFLLALNCTDRNPIMIWDQRERLVTTSPVVTKSRDRPSWGRNDYPENGLVKESNLVCNSSSFCASSAGPFARGMFE